uniref:Sulfate transporter n=1 Tax=Cacopsylla melanoneura TaxID=428564 RepID=A0A8D8ZR69_9HEMI
MAYAILAAVPPIVGIYMAFFPVFIYMLMGTSRHLSMGTFSVICMMTSKAVLMYSDPKYLLSDAPPPIHSIHNVSGIPPGSHNGSLTEDVVRTSLYATGYSTGLTPIQVASAVCFVVGVWHVILGALKLGSLSVLMSDSMISGFTSGTAFIVIASQIKHVFGISLPRHSGPLKVIMTIVDTINNFDKTNWLALEIAVGVTLALIFYMQFLKSTST